MSGDTTTGDGSGSGDDVSRILVCTGHLCECQDEGDNGSDILSKLNELSDSGRWRSSAPVEDTDCLGCCGTGAIVCLEMSDGTDRLVTGMDETLRELGALN